MDFKVRFIGHIDEVRRPEGFPKKIYSDMYARVANNQELMTAINGWAKMFLSQHCMIVPKDPSETEDFGRVKYDARMLVPMHMITHITTETTLIQSEVPEVGEDGTVQLMDGSKPLIQ